MLVLSVQGKNYNELKQNALSALGMSEPSLQMELPLSSKGPDNTPVGSASESAEVKTTKRGRTPKQKQEAEVFEAVVEGKEISPEVIAEEAAIVQEPPKSLDHLECRSILAKVIDKKGMDTAIKICEQFKVKKVTELSPNDFVKFAEECEKHLS